MRNERIFKNFSDGFIDSIGSDNISNPNQYFS